MSHPVGLTFYTACFWRMLRERGVLLIVWSASRFLVVARPDHDNVSLGLKSLALASISYNYPSTDLRQMEFPREGGCQATHGTFWQGTVE
eukprot:gene12662-biopygen3452